MKACIAPRCDRTLQDDATFCDRCRAPQSAGAGGQHISTGGGDFEADNVYQAGGDIHIGLRDSDERNLPAPTYDTKWSWSSPLTQASLAWIGVVLGILSLVAGYQGFKPLYDLITRGGQAVTVADGTPWLYALGGLAILLGLTLGLRRVAVNRTQHLGSSGLLPALTGWNGRIGLARFQGRCFDGGKLTFYNKPSEWFEDVNTGKRRVTKREMVAECRRDPRHHVWLVSPVDGPEDVPAVEK